MRILIADDDRAIVDLFKAFFKKKTEHEVDGVYCGNDALTLLAKVIYDLVILDKTMPDIEGDEIVKYIRQNGLKTKIIIFSGVIDPSAEQDPEKKADIYLQKPIDLPSIHKTISELFQE